MPRRKVIPGIRYFKCECGFQWGEPCRDHETLSVSDCPQCGEVSSPEWSEPIEEIKP